MNNSNKMVAVVDQNSPNVWHSLCCEEWKGAVYIREGGAKWKEYH